jgi:iron complex outermembrane receptor protein
VQLLPVVLYTPQSIQNADHGQHIKVKFSANWTLDRWSANLVETFYGPYFSMNSPNAGVYYKEERGATGTTDLEIDYALTDELKLGIGGRNILNKVPEFGPTTPTGGLVNTGDSIRNNPIGTGYGPDGGYYYARIAYTF